MTPQAAVVSIERTGDLGDPVGIARAMNIRRWSSSPVGGNASRGIASALVGPKEPLAIEVD